MSTKRVHFRENQRLTHRGFSDEQAYRIKMRRRHNLAHHRWGIVQGLVLEATRTGVALSPGFAVDGYGRELIVLRALELRQQVLEGVLDGGTTGFVDAWLTYHILSSGDSRGKCYEDAWVRLDCADSARSIKPGNPPGVPQSDLDFGPDREPPDDPEREWPVYLGRIAVGAGDPLKSPYSRNAIELTELAYASLAGASLQTPAGYRWMQLGDDEAGDNRRFVVSLPDEQGQSHDRLVLGRDGDASFWGRPRLSPAHTGDLKGDGDLALIGTAPQGTTGGGLALEALDAVPETARAWQLYRTAVEVEQGEKRIKTHIDQLRVETFDPGEEGDPTRSGCAVGGVAALSLVDTADADQKLAVIARSGGKWGNRLFACIGRAAGTTFHMTVLYYRVMPPLPLIDPTDPANNSDPNRREPDVVERHCDLGIDPAGPRYCVTTVNGSSRLVKLVWIDSTNASFQPNSIDFTQLSIYEDSPFAPLLTVRSDGTVIVTHDLRVEGQLIEGAIPADVEDERFRDELLERWTKGLTLAGTEVDAYYELPLDVSLTLTPHPDVNGQVDYAVTITNSGGGISREVPILTILSEFRDDDRLLVYSARTEPGSPNPLPPGNSMNVSATATLSVKGALTLTVRVFALGAAQNAVEKTANAVFSL